MWPASWSNGISQFYYSDINLFLIDAAWYNLCNIWLLLWENNSRSIRSYQYRSLTLEEKYCCGNYSRQGQRWRFESGKVKHELRITSSNPRVTSSNPQVTSSNPRVASSNLRVMSLNPRARRLKSRFSRLKARFGRLKAQVGKLKERVGRLKAWIRKLKARVEAIKPRGT